MGSLWIHLCNQWKWCILYDEREKLGGYMEVMEEQPLFLSYFFTFQCFPLTWLIRILPILLSSLFLYPSSTLVSLTFQCNSRCLQKEKKKEVHSWWVQDASLHIVFCKHTLALKTTLSLQKQNICKKSRTVHSRHRDETTCRIRWCECKSVTQEPLVNPCAPLLHTVTGVPACLFSLFTGGQVCDEWGP